MTKIAVTRWSERDRESHTVEIDQGLLVEIIEALRAAPDLDNDTYSTVVKSFADRTGYLLTKSELVDGYRKLVATGVLDYDRETMRRLQRKPVRTGSGVAPVTVLTKPYPCPGECIFCPTVDGMPKSYVPGEPGAQRALQNDFDPYRQTLSRIHSFEAIGHDAGKVELLILGGTWSAYPRQYQEWFVKRCFDAMNGATSETLAEAQQVNETARHRNVGLVIETRPCNPTPGGGPAPPGSDQGATGPAEHG